MKHIGCIVYKCLSCRNSIVFRICDCCVKTSFKSTICICIIVLYCFQSINCRLKCFKSCIYFGCVSLQGDGRIQLVLCDSKRFACCRNSIVFCICDCCVKTSFESTIRICIIVLYCFQSINCRLKCNDLIGKIVVAACNRILKHFVGVVKLLKFLCDSRKIDVKLNRDQNLLRWHGKAICAVAIIDCGNAVNIHCVNKITKIWIYRNGYGVTNSGLFHINGIVTASGASVIEQINVIRNLLIDNVHHYIGGRHREGKLIFCNLGSHLAVYGNVFYLVALVWSDGCSKCIANNYATGLKNYTSVQTLANACVISAKCFVVSSGIGCITSNGCNLGIPTCKGVDVLGIFFLVCATFKLGCFSV